MTFGAGRGVVGDGGKSVATKEKTFGRHDESEEGSARVA